MAYTIAVAGKGGVGKTTICGLLIDHLCRKKNGPVLAVDADANSNLNEVLGVDVELTLGDLREEVAKAEMVKDSPIPPSMSKQDYLNYKFSEVLIEEDDYDMLVMGRTQGSGCYCFVNGLLQAQLSRISGNYQYIVVDNEAGMEHISRGILPKVDTILLVSDCSRRGIQAVGRIAHLVKEVQMDVKTVKLIVNRAPEEKLDEAIQAEIEKQGLDLLGVLPADSLVYEYDLAGKPTVQLPEDAPVRKALAELLRQLEL
ncbi:AAA family ATPase [Hominifimenecus sp. rT4P-3]|uniref:ATP-binding protein n=1 Tax=Hominifimenecus sp. rT4P-3 TaxID=3242979 RepID=UPI003DA31149